MDDISQAREVVERARAALEAEAAELVRASRRLNDNLGEALRRIWRQLLLIWTVGAVLAVTYFLVVAYVLPGAQAPVSPGASPAVPPASLGSGPDTLPDFPEREELAGLLNRIREAQYAKDPELFFSVYAPTLPDLARKREAVLKMWQRYDYLDMHYQVMEFRSAGEGVVQGRITWDFTTRDRETRAVRSYSKSYGVTFSRESGRWLIRELEPLSEAESFRLRQK